MSAGSHFVSSKVPVIILGTQGPRGLRRELHNVNHEPEEGGAVVVAEEGLEGDGDDDGGGAIDVDGAASVAVDVGVGVGVGVVVVELSAPADVLNVVLYGIV